MTHSVSLTVALNAYSDDDARRLADILASRLLELAPGTVEAVTAALEGDQRHG